eukprot:3850186-Ditylum_brightwellii.AAC.1
MAINTVTHQGQMQLYHDSQCIPEDYTITYMRVIVNFPPQNADSNQVCITAGGNSINYLHKLTIRTADLTTSKVIPSSILSTEDEQLMGIDMKNLLRVTRLS